MGLSSSKPKPYPLTVPAALDSNLYKHAQVTIYPDALPSRKGKEWENGPRRSSMPSNVNPGGVAYSNSVGSRTGAQLYGPFRPVDQNQPPASNGTTPQPVQPPPFVPPPPPERRAPEPVLPPPPIIFSSSAPNMYQPAGPSFPAPAVPTFPSSTTSDYTPAANHRRTQSDSRRYHPTPYRPAFAMPEPDVPSQPQPEQYRQRPTGRTPDVQRVLQPLSPPNPSVFGPPGPRPRTPISNPLPTPPRDIYEISPYKSLLNLPQTTALLTATYGNATGNGSLGRSGSVNTTSSQNGARKKPLKGLFRSLSGKRRDQGSSSADRGREIPFVPVFIPQPQPQPQSQPQTNAPPSGATMTMPEPEPARVPPVRFDHRGELAGFMNHSPHRVLYQNKTFPSALHLHEALKFIGHRPDLAERIRKCPRVQDVYPLSASLHEYVRSDWGQVFLTMMEEVLYLKFKQHPDLRNLLLNTGAAPIIYAEANDSFWGEGPLGQGLNELGKALRRVRDRLRTEGFGS